MAASIDEIQFFDEYWVVDSSAVEIKPFAMEEGGIKEIGMILKNELSVDLAGKVKTIVIVGDKLIEAPIIITAKADRKIVVLIILFIIVLIIAIIRYIIYKIRLWKQLRRIELMEEQKRRLDAQEKELERKHNILMRIAQRLKHHVTRQKDIKDDVEMKKSRIRAFIHRIKTHMDRLKKK